MGRVWRGACEWAGSPRPTSVAIIICMRCRLSSFIFDSIYEVMLGVWVYMWWCINCCGVCCIVFSLFLCCIFEACMNSGWVLCFDAMFGLCILYISSHFNLFSVSSNLKDSTLEWEGLKNDEIKTYHSNQSISKSSSL